MVEQEAVNFEVTGSSPVRGAKEISRHMSRYFFHPEVDTCASLINSC